MLPHGPAFGITGRLRGGVMRLQQIRTLVLFSLMFAFVVGILHVTAQQETAPAISAPMANATVVGFDGNVQVQLPGEKSSAPSLNQVLRADSEIQTGKGHLMLRLEDDSEVVVHPNTHLVLKDPATSNWQ